MKKVLILLFAFSAFFMFGPKQFAIAGTDLSHEISAATLTSSSSVMLAQEATATPSPTGAEAVASDMDSIAALIASKSSIIAMVLALLLGVAKRFSTEKSTGVVAVIQKVIDVLPKLLTSLGNLLKTICDILASVIASDGILGKK